MRLLKTALLSTVMFIPAMAFCQQEPMPEKLSPEMVKILREQEQRMKASIEESNNHPGPKFGIFQCRADAQKWTTDPFDSKDARNLGVNTAVIVNGQFRSMPPITPHVTVAALMDRVYEMEVCKSADAEI